MDEGSGEKASGDETIPEIGEDLGASSAPAAGSEAAEAAEEPELQEVKKDGQRAKDPKSWFSIVLVAALTGIGTQLAVAGFKVANEYIPKTIAIGANVVDKQSRPLEGARVELRDGEQIIGTGNTNEYGAVKLEVRVRNGPYLLVSHYKNGGVEYVANEYIVIEGSLVRKLQFDPDVWRKLGGEKAETVESRYEAGQADNEAFRAQGPSWLATALGEAGRYARFPPDSNPRIMEYLKSVHGFTAENDSVGWSSAFVNWVLQQNNIAGTNSILDRPWLTWGKAVAVEPGCIAVFQWQSGGMHVAFVIKADQDSVTTISGNVWSASDSRSSVSIRRYPRAYLLGCRMPS